MDGGAMVLILGIDRFMSERRALTNFVGNGVATMVVSNREGALDRTMLSATLGANDGGWSLRRARRPRVRP